MTTVAWAGVEDPGDHFLNLVNQDWLERLPPELKQ
jgi:hypothetical protein